MKRSNRISSAFRNVVRRMVRPDLWNLHALRQLRGLEGQSQAVSKLLSKETNDLRQLKSHTKDLLSTAPPTGNYSPRRISKALERAAETLLFVEAIISDLTVNVIRYPILSGEQKSERTTMSGLLKYTWRLHHHAIPVASYPLLLQAHCWL